MFPPLTIGSSTRACATPLRLTENTVSNYRVSVRYGSESRSAAWPGPLGGNPRHCDAMVLTSGMGSTTAALRPGSHLPGTARNHAADHRSCGTCAPCSPPVRPAERAGPRECTARSRGPPPMRGCSRRSTPSGGLGGDGARRDARRGAPRRGRREPHGGLRQATATGGGGGPARIPCPAATSAAYGTAAAVAERATRRSIARIS